MNGKILRAKNEKKHDRKCDKGVVLVDHNGVKYTVVFHNTKYKFDQKLKVYWNGSNGEDWGQSIDIEHKPIIKQGRVTGYEPFEFDNTIEEHKVAKCALALLGGDSWS